jgi:hypothetical protein
MKRRLKDFGRIMQQGDAGVDGNRQSLLKFWFDEDRRVG